MAFSAERCSVSSESRHEPFVGTASVVRRWILLQHDGPWGDRPLLDARLPDDLGGALGALERERGIRVLLIRRPDRDDAETGACFVVRSGPDGLGIERTLLQTPGDVMDLDLDAVGRNEPLGLERVHGPLFLVCTHGRHDPCCAKRGRPTALALASARPLDTWEVSHVGGDRFAPNVLAFPHGWYFGRVEPGAAPGLASAYAAGRIDLRHARGRSCYAMDVQAAELFLRRGVGLDGVDDVSVAAVERRGRRSTVAFDGAARRFRVSVIRTRLEPARLTCHAVDERAAGAFAMEEIEEA